MKSWRLAVGAVLGVCAWGTVLACGQVAPVEHARPGATVEIRGYGYGFEGNDRPVLLRWAHDGSSAGTARIDADGNFNATVQMSKTVGLHKLIVSQGDGDPASVEVTVPVVGSWSTQAADLLGSPPVNIASFILASLGLLGVAFMGLRLWRNPRLVGIA